MILDSDKGAKWVNLIRTSAAAIITSFDLSSKPTGPPPIKQGDHNKPPCNNNHHILSKKKSENLLACATYVLSDRSSYQYTFEYLHFNMIDLAT